MLLFKTLNTIRAGDSEVCILQVFRLLLQNYRKEEDMRLVSLKTDYVFKEVFSHENVRKQFLSDVLGIPLECIRAVRITHPYLLR